MGEKKVTIMVMKVDLQCSKCYKKVKKVLCKFPKIQDQVYDEKTNTVRIKVVCCSPEKIRDKLCCKGKGLIKSIEILEPEKPKPPPAKKPEKPEEPEKTPEKPKEPEKSKPSPEPAPAPVAPPLVLVPCYPRAPKFGQCCRECYEGRAGGPCYQNGHGPVAPAPVPVPCYPPAPNFGQCCRECSEGRDGGPCHQPLPCYPPAPNFGQCCRECSEGRAGGPCYQLGYGQVRYYDGYYGRAVYDSWGGGCNNRVYRSRCTDYICEENPTAPCSIM